MKNNSPENAPCITCGLAEPEVEFYKAPNKRGRGSYCKQCQKNRSRKWQEENRERYQVLLSNWRSKNKTRETFILEKEWLLLKSEYKNSCVRCGKTEPEIQLGLDHIIPISKGGLDHIDNIQPLCKGCNYTKNSQIVDYRERWKKQESLDRCG